MSEINDLIDRVLEIAGSAENKRRAARWLPQPDWARDHWRGVPRRKAGVSRREAGVPFTVEPENALWSHILGFDLKEYYTDPVTFLRARLRMSIYRFDHFPDHTIVGDAVPIWFGVPFEHSMFGMEWQFTSGNDPWIGRTPVVRSREDLRNAPRPDFFESGLSAEAHRFYNELRKMVDGRLRIIFPEWGRGPAGVAMHLRGMEDFLCDLRTDAEFAHELMEFVTDCRIEWSKARSNYLGVQVQPANLYNDVIDSPTISPKDYEEFVLPCEMRIAEFHGGVAYWHSCGRTDDFAALVGRLPRLGMYHVGPWTSVAAVCKALGPDVPLEVCLHPVSEVQMASEDEMRSRLESIVEQADGAPLTIRADGLQLLRTLDEELAAVDRFLGVAREALGY